MIGKTKKELEEKKKYISNLENETSTLKQENSKLKELASGAKDKLAEVQAFIKKVTSPPFIYGTVVNLNEDSVDVSVNGKVMELNYVDEIKSNLVPGACVRLNPENYAVVKTRNFNGTGCFATIEEILEDGRAVIDDHGRKHILKTSSEINKRDRVVTDPSFNVILQNLGKESTQYNIEEVPVVPWENIGGLENAIQVLKDSIEEPFLNKEVYARYGKKVPKGVLLYGPPGCGKTLLAKAAAYNLSQRMKKQGKSNGNGYFLSIKGPELLDKYVGESEKGIRNIFDRARKNCKTRNDVTVIFMDEAESLLKKRGSSISSDIYDSIVPQFLSEMDGVTENEGLVLILASNREDIIDPAVLRPGRIDRKIKVDKPNQYATEKIFEIHLNGMPIYNNGSKKTEINLSKYASREIFGEQYPLFEIDFNDKNKGYIFMRDILSGAMIESIAQRAAGLAIKREIREGKSGLTKKDLDCAIKQEYEENRGVVRVEREDIKQAFPDRYDSIVSINRCYGVKNGN